MCVRPASVETLLRRTNGTKTPKSLLSCFRTVRHFAEALDDDDDCGEMARRSLSIKPAMPHMKLLSGHVSLGSCAYLGGTLEELRNKSVYLINTETWLGLTLTLTLILTLALTLTLPLSLTLPLILTRRAALAGCARGAHNPTPTPNPNPTP